MLSQGRLLTVRAGPNRFATPFSSAWSASTTTRSSLSSSSSGLRPTAPIWATSRCERIPSAAHLEWTERLDPAGRIDRSGRALARLAATGALPDRPVVLGCTGGVRSSEAFVALKALGFGAVRNHDGSWYDWSAQLRHPVAR